MADDLSAYLELGPERKVSFSQLQENFKYLQSSLLSFGLPQLGNIFSDDEKELKKTIDCVYSLLQQRQKDLSFRGQVQDRIQRLESEKSMYQQKIESLNDELNSSKSGTGKVENRLKQEMEKWKKEKEKVISERDDLKKEVTKMIGKEGKMIHDSKKKDAVIEKMKEQLRKALGEKDVVYSNGFEMVAVLHSSGPKMTTSNGEKEFVSTLVEGYDENQNYLLNENQDLRSALETIQKELHFLMEERKEYVIKNFNKVPNVNTVELNKQIFQAPFQSVSEDLMETFFENIRKFKQLFSITAEMF
jgi:X breakpoint 2-interacting protein